MTTHVERMEGMVVPWWLVLLEGLVAVIIVGGILAIVAAFAIRRNSVGATTPGAGEARPV